MSGPEPKTLVARDGVEVAYSEWGSPTDEPLVVFMHATGFCKEVCFPVIDDLHKLSSGFRTLALDQRAHGDSAVPEPPFSWWDVAADILELIGATSRVIGVGHSAGGAALAMAEILEPGTFVGLVLVEPIVFPPPYGRFPDNPMSTAARRRRDRFVSRQAAFDNWRHKPAFAGWEERALWAYANGGLRNDGSSYLLKCSRESEAETFMAATEHGAWDRLGEIATPTEVIAGEHSTTHQEPFLKEMVGRMPAARYEIVPGTSHMVWMERPGLIAEHVARFL